MTCDFINEGQQLNNRVEFVRRGFGGFGRSFGGGGRGLFGRSGGGFKPTFKKRWGMGSSKGKSGGFFSKKAKPAKSAKSTSKGKTTGTGAKAGAGVGAGGVTNNHVHVHQPGLFGGFTMWHLPLFMNWRCRAVNPEGFRCGGSTGLFSNYCEHHRDGKWREAAGKQTPKSKED